MAFYKEMEPGPELLHLVKCFWMVDFEGEAPFAGREDLLPPDGFIEVVFNYKTSYLSKITGQWHPLPRHYIVGQLRSPLAIKAVSGIGILGIRLHPWATAALFGLRPKAFGGKIADLAEIRPGLIDAVMPLLNANPQLETLRQLEKILLSGSILDLSADISFAVAASAYIANRQGTFSVEEMARDFHFSVRQLSRKFGEEFGISPKAYARIVRFNLIRENMLFGDAPADARTASDYEFADQAHMVKEIKEMAGYPPREMRRRFAETMDSMPDGNIEFIARRKKKPAGS